MDDHEPCSTGTVDGVPWAKVRTQLVRGAVGAYPNAASEFDAVCLALSNEQGRRAEWLSVMNLNAEQAGMIAHLRMAIEAGITAISTGRNEPLVVWREQAAASLRIPFRSATHG